MSAARLLLRLLMLVLCGWMNLALAVATEPLNEFLPSREWGTPELFLPASKARDVLLMFSGVAGVEAQDRQAAERLRSQGYALALVDSAALVRWAKEDRAACLELAAVGQWLSQTMQQRLGLEDFRPAVVLGRGAGAWVVHSLLAQAPEGVFQAGLSVNFMPGNPTARPLCGVATVAADRHVAPDTVLHGAWALAATQALNFDAVRYARQAAAAGDQTEPWVKQGKDYAELASAFMLWVNAPRARLSRSTLSAMPVVELVPQAKARDPALENISVVFFSGDGGWRDIDQQVGRALAEDGLHVLGIDALRYFWRKRTPQGVAADLATLLAQHAPAQPSPPPRLVLIGYSFGANILPLVYAESPPAVRERVMLSVLLSPELRTDFEIHMAGWLGAQAGEHATPILPAVLKMPAAQVVCVQGMEEGDDSLCSQAALAQAGITLVRLPGGHHYDEDYVALAGRIVALIRQRTPESGRR